MFDIKALEAEAKKEVDEERAKHAKTKIKAKLRDIANARAVLRNLEEEYAVLLHEVGGDVVS